MKSIGMQLLDNLLS